MHNRMYQFLGTGARDGPLRFHRKRLFNLQHTKGLRDLLQAKSCHMSYMSRKDSSAPEQVIITPDTLAAFNRFGHSTLSTNVSRV